MAHDLLVKQAQDCLFAAASASILIRENMANTTNANATACQVVFSPMSPLFAHHYCGCSVSDSLLRTMPEGNHFSVRLRSLPYGLQANISAFDI